MITFLNICGHSPNSFMYSSKFSLLSNLYFFPSQQAIFPIFPFTKRLTQALDKKYERWNKQRGIYISPSCTLCLSFSLRQIIVFLLAVNVSLEEIVLMIKILSHDTIVQRKPKPPRGVSLSHAHETRRWKERNKLFSLFE